MEKKLVPCLVLIALSLSACNAGELPNQGPTSITATNDYTESGENLAPPVAPSITATRYPTPDNSEIRTCELNAALQSCSSSIVIWLTNVLRLQQIDQIANLVSPHGAAFVKANTDFFLPFKDKELFSQALQENLNIGDVECLGFTTRGEANGFLEIYYKGLSLSYFENQWETDILLFGFAYEDDKYDLVGVGPILRDIYEATFDRNPPAACPEE